MRRVEIPPLWLLAFLGLEWLQARLWPVPALGRWADWLGGALVLAGFALMLAAVAEMARARTTVWPRAQASSLVTSGIFRLSRNPIYLGDALVLAGCALAWSAVSGLLLVPLFTAIITRRFIRGEEAGLARAFGPAFEAYRRRTRRWI